MKYKLTLLSIFCLLLSSTGIKAQVDTIPDLIISEVQFYKPGNLYLELTNMGDSALDLSQFSLQQYNQSSEYYYGLRNMDDFLWLEGILEPQESYVLSPVKEVPRFYGPGYRPAMAEISDKLIYPREAISEELAALGVVDSVSDNGPEIFTLWGGRGSYVLKYYTPAGDSIVIDAVNNAIDDNDRWAENRSVAGVEAAAETHVLVRKFSVKQGTPVGDGESNWDAARGTDIEDSEWIPIPHKGDEIEYDIYTTVGNHGDYHIDVTPKTADITIDQDAPAMTIPWGIYRGDSIIDYLNLGKGMAWWYSYSADLEDSTHTICQTGDVLTLYACGNTLEQKDYALTVSAPATDMALVFPKNRKIFNDANPFGTWNTPFYVTEGIPGIDTIGAVPFAARRDTLYKYLEKAPNASWEIVWVDDQERLDLKKGDILRITAEDGATTKEYYIDVQDFEGSSNANLASINWPDLDLDPGFMLDQGWIHGDTLPNFSPEVSSYNILLPYGTRNVPALTVVAEDPNAEVVIDRATSLTGGFDQRTTTFTVTAEDDSTEMVYNVLFTVMQPSEYVQPNHADPLISEIVVRWNNRTCWIEITNPGNQPLDLSNYMVVSSTGNDLPNIINYDLNFSNRYNYYVPGFKYTSDTATFEANGRILELDAIDPVLDPGESFLIAAWTDSEKVGIEDAQWAMDISDIFFDRDVDPNHFNQLYPGRNTVGFHHGMNSTILLYKIVGDSVLDGTKALGDPEDFSLIDVFGSYDKSPWEAGGVSCVVDGKIRTNGWRYIRKPEYWHGNTDIVAAMANEYTAEGSPLDMISQSDLINNLDAHVMEPVTAHMSTVSSLVYLVDNGFEGDLGIEGISNSETVQDLFDNLIKADPGQVLVVTAEDDTEKAGGDAIVAGDKLIVTSANGANETIYTLSTTPLDANTNLVAAEGSGLTVDNTAGIISGFDFGTELAVLAENISTESDYTLINIIDEESNLIPLTMMNAEGNYNQVLAGSNIIFEVIAQNGDVKIFNLTPTASDSDAYVISNLFTVDNERNIISMIPGGISVSSFFDAIEPSPGASASIMDQLDLERTFGAVKYDDELVVISPDGTATRTYLLTFLEEVIVNSAPLVELAFTDSTIQKNETLMVSAMANDDGYPVESTLSYSWSVTSGDAANVTIANPEDLSTDVTFTVAGNYVLTIEVSDGDLSSTESINVTVEEGTGIDPRNKPQLKMYPNPARDVLTIELYNMFPGASTLRIVDHTGRIVQEILPEGNMLNIDLSMFESGIYFVTVDNGKSHIVQKLSVLK